MDKSNGYEDIAPIFIKGRGQAVNGVGADTVRNLAKELDAGSTVLDVGCGTGIPMTKILLEAGMVVHAVDASPAMVSAFKKNFPLVPVACEAAEESSFFNQYFDAILAWGLIFLMPEEAQIELIPKLAAALKPGGKLLFTSPAKAIQWRDAMTDQWSRSLGAEKYKRLMSLSGLQLIEELEDEGGNHYYLAMKIIE
jgi:2-polyprenyl-3-methyl-5-hydroxy-6-metoxy-1,4-benzoquinol methylase